MRAEWIRVLGLSGLCFLAACSKGDETKSAHLSTNWIGKSITASSTGLSSLGLGQATPGAGGLQKMEYFFTSVMVCEGASFSGSGWSNASGCSSLYQNGTNLNYINYLLADGDAETTSGRYIDVLSQSSLSQMNRSLTVTPGTYKVGFVNFMRPFRVQAAINDGSQTLVTKANGTNLVGFCLGDNTGGKTASDCAKPEDFFQRRSTTNMTGTSGTSELASFMNTNGGTQFVFSSPITIAENENVTMDLVVDPDYLVTAGSGNDSVSPASYCQDANGDGSCESPWTAMSFAFIDIAPVIRKENQNTYRAVYETTSAINAGVTGQDHTMRISLYYAAASSSDLGAASIQAVNIRAISQTKAMATTGGVTQSAVVTNNKVTLKDWQGASVVDGLTVTTTVGQVVTGASIDFSKLGVVGGILVPNVSFELVKIEQVN